MSTLTRSGARGLRSLFPAHPLGSLSQEIDDLVRQFRENFDGDWAVGECVPSLDLAESNGNLEVKMDVPGFAPDEIDIEITGDTLSVSGRHKEEKTEENKEKKFYRVERRSGSFQRTVTLPCAVKESEVSAQYQDGVLTITLPKTDAARTHKVAING